MNKQTKRMMKKKIAIVGSVDQGKPSIKAMVVTRREDGGVFYFDSNHSAQTVASWKECPSACVYFCDRLIYRGVKLSGTMEIIDDMALKEQHWKPSKKAIYKGGAADPDYCILKFTATGGRYYFMYQVEDFEI